MELNPVHYSYNCNYSDIDKHALLNAIAEYKQRNRDLYFTLEGI